MAGSILGGEKFCWEAFDLKIARNGHEGLKLAKMTIFGEEPCIVVFWQKVVKNEWYNDKFRPAIIS